MAEGIISQPNLKKFIKYHPNTGLFVNLIYRGAAAQAGTIAGWIDGEGYIQIKFFGKCYKAHRLAWFYMTGIWPDEIDHINHKRTDNRWSNLRAGDKFMNQQNKGMQRDNTSGHTGVCWHKGTQKWIAYIRHNKVRIHIGVYVKKIDAIDARIDMEVKLGFHPNHGL